MRFFLFLYSLYLGANINIFLNFFVFANIFDYKGRNSCVCVVNNFADM